MIDLRPTPKHRRDLPTGAALDAAIAEWRDREKARLAQCLGCKRELPDLRCDEFGLPRCEACHKWRDEIDEAIEAHMYMLWERELARRGELPT